MKLETKAHRVLVDARELLRAGWCQGSHAVGESGEGVPWRTPNARKFCAVGAILRATWMTDWDGEVEQLAIDSIQRVLMDRLEADTRRDDSSLENFNDMEEMTQQEVLDLFSYVIGDGD